MKRKSFFLLTAFCLTAGNCVWTDETPFFNQPVKISTYTVNVPAGAAAPRRRRHLPTGADIQRSYKKYGKPNPRVEEPSAQPMPSQAPEMPTFRQAPPPAPAPPAPQTATERFFAGAARIMTYTKNNNLFVWLPAIATDPNAGPTYGVLPVTVISNPVTNHIRHLLAPSYTYNSIFGQTATMRYFYYPTDESQLYTIGSFSQHTNREIKVRYENTAAWDGMGYVYAEGAHDVDASDRFYGLGPGTHSQDETGYTAGDTYARGDIGLNFFKYWRASTGIRFRTMDVDHTIVPGVNDLANAFPTLAGLGTKNTVAYECRLFMDSRDYPITPSRGSSGEVWFEKTFQTLGSDSIFIRYGAEAKHFFIWENHPDQVTVIHGLYEWVNGPYIPFYELTSVGGRDTLRGFGEGRFTDRGRMVFNVEQRMRIASLTMMGIKTNFEIAPFIDGGEVFPTLPQAEIRNFHPVYGTAFRAAVKPNVVGSVDVGVGNEGPAVFVGINYPF
jgi:hypothetical protein